MPHASVKRDTRRLGRRSSLAARRTGGKYISVAGLPILDLVLPARPCAQGFLISEQGHYI